MEKISLEDLGYSPDLEDYRQEHQLDAFLVGRVISEHKDRYVVKTDTGEFDAELIGNLRFTAESRADLPAVGDWVAISAYDEDKALIHALFPRHSMLERQAVGKTGQNQIIATNIDCGFIVQAVNRDFNINRLERYLTICHAAQVKPIILLNKIDLIETSEVESLLQQIAERIKGIPIIAMSNESQIGLDQVKATIKKGKTYCLLGSSGVGKSTLLNNLLGETLMNTGAISESIDRGKHITRFRKLIVLPNGGILIDNPGIREVGIADTSLGLEATFDFIIQLTQDCKFKDCTHQHEKGCAVLEALAEGTLEEAAYQNFQKLQREKAHYESTVLERKKKERDFGKMYKRVVKDRKRKKF